MRRLFMNMKWEKRSIFNWILLGGRFVWQTSKSVNSWCISMRFNWFWFSRHFFCTEYFSFYIEKYWISPFYKETCWKSLFYWETFGGGEFSMEKRIKYCLFIKKHTDFRLFMEKHTEYMQTECKFFNRERLQYVSRWQWSELKREKNVRVPTNWWPASRN